MISTRRLGAKASGPQHEQIRQGNVLLISIIGRDHLQRHVIQSWVNAGGRLLPHIITLARFNWHCKCESATHSWLSIRRWNRPLPDQHPFVYQNEWLRLCVTMTGRCAWNRNFTGFFFPPPLFSPRMYVYVGHYTTWMLANDRVRRIDYGINITVGILFFSPLHWCIGTLSVSKDSRLQVARSEISYSPCLRYRGT